MLPRGCGFLRRVYEYCTRCERAARSAPRAHSFGLSVRNQSSSGRTSNSENRSTRIPRCSDAFDRPERLLAAAVTVAHERRRPRFPMPLMLLRQFCALSQYPQRRHLFIQVKHLFTVFVALSQHSQVRKTELPIIVAAIEH